MDIRRSAARLESGEGKTDIRWNVTVHSKKLAHVSRSVCVFLPKSDRDDTARVAASEALPGIDWFSGKELIGVMKVAR